MMRRPNATVMVTALEAEEVPSQAVSVVASSMVVVARSRIADFQILDLGVPLSDGRTLVDRSHRTARTTAVVSAEVIEEASAINRGD